MNDKLEIGLIFWQLVGYANQLIAMVELYRYLLFADYADTEWNQ